MYGRALVLWNAAAASAALGAVPTGQNPCLVVGQQQLGPFTLGGPGNAILALPGQDMEFTAEAITSSQIGSHRASYINAILIQSRGVLPSVACTQC